MNNEELRDELLALTNSQSRIYVFFKSTNELVGIPVRQGVRRVYARLGNSAYARYTDCYSSYMLDMDKTGRLYFVKHRSCYTKDDSILTFRNKGEKYSNIKLSNLVYYDILTPEEMHKLNKNSMVLPNQIAILDEKMKPIKGLDRLYCEHSGLIEFLTFDHDNSAELRESDDYLKLIKSPGDGDAYLSLLQTSRHAYGRGIAKMGVETAKKIILERSGRSSAVMSGQMIPLDNELKYNFSQGEEDGGVFFDGKEIFSDTKFKQQYYALIKIYKKLGFDFKSSVFKGIVRDEGEFDYVTALHPLVVAKFKKDYIGSLPKEFLAPDENAPEEKE